MISTDALNFMKGLVGETLPGADRPEFWDTLKDQFSRLDEQLVADAVEKALGKPETTADNLLAVITDEVNKLRIYQFFTGSCAPKKGDMDVVRMAMSLIKDGNWKTPISDKIRRFARRAWPDISDDLIRQNYDILSHAADSCGRLDPEHYIRLRLQKDGMIVEDAVQRI